MREVEIGLVGKNSPQTELQGAENIPQTLGVAD